MVRSSEERGDEKRPVPHEDMERVAFDPSEPGKIFKIGTNLDTRHRLELISLIREFKGVFA